LTGRNNKRPTGLNFRNLPGPEAGLPLFGNLNYLRPGPGKQFSFYNFLKRPFPGQKSLTKGIQGKAIILKCWSKVAIYEIPLSFKIAALVASVRVMKWRSFYWSTPL